MTRILDSFEVLGNGVPIEKRFICNSLSEITNPYEGLLTYCLEDSRTYQYANGKFNIFSNGVYVNVKDFGAKGDRVHDDTLAIQRAINSIKNNEYDAIKRGGVVFFPTGSYHISDTIELPSFITLMGEGDLSSILYLADGVNKDMIKTEKFDELLESGKSWFDVSGVPMGFGIKNLGLFGNRTHNDNCNGISIYGYFYKIENVTINYCGGTGFFSKHGNEIGGTEVYQANFSKFFETKIDNLNVKYCKSRGIDYNGPTDSSLNNLYVSECEGDFGASFAKACYIGDIHLYGNNRATTSGCGLNVNADCYIKNVVSESNYGGGVQINSWLAHIERCQMYGNRQYNLSILANSNYTKFGSVDIKPLKNDVTSISIASDDIVIDKVTIFGDVDFTYTKQAISVFTSNNTIINNCFLGNIKGGGVALACNQGAKLSNIKANGIIKNCDVAFSPGAGFNGNSNIELLVERSASQKTLEFDFEPTITDTISIKEKIDGSYNVLFPYSFNVADTYLEFTNRNSKQLNVTNSKGKYLQPLSTNVAVATIDESYNVTPVANGTCVIILSLNGISKYVYVNVNIAE